MADAPQKPKKASKRSPKDSRLDEAREDCHHGLGLYMADSDSFRALLGVSPTVEALDAPGAIKRELDRLSASLPPAQRSLVLRIIVEYVEAQAGGSQPIQPHVYDSHLVPTGDRLPARRRAGTTRTITGDAAHVLTAALRYIFLRRHTPPQLPRFYRSLLITRVASFEQLLGAIHGAFYKAHPEALSKSKTITIGDLHSYSSINAVIDAAVGEEVDAFKRGGLDDWMDWFSKYPKLDPNDYSGDLAAVREILLRRHIAVHNDERISRQYLQGVPASDLKVGTRLVLDADYMEAADDQLLVLGASLAAATWIKIAPSDAASANKMISDLVFELMVAGRWQAVEDLCRIARSRLSPGAGAATVSQMNEWLARKRLHGLTAIESQVEGFDVGALDAPFRIGRLALVDRFDDLAPALEAALDREQIGMWDLYNWPILEEFRQRPEFAEMIATHAPAGPPPSKDGEPAKAAKSLPNTSPATAGPTRSHKRPEVTSRRNRKSPSP
jgi:hypothetical protein